MRFDASDIPTEDEGRPSFELLPSGWYHVRIVEAVTNYSKDPSSRAGLMLSLKVEIDGNEHPKYNNRTVFSNLCPNHETSPVTVKIARRKLSAISHAVGVVVWDDEKDLLGGKLLAKIITEPAKGQYPAKNSVDEWMAIGKGDKPKRSAAVDKVVEKFDGEVIDDPRPAEEPKRSGWR